MPVQTETETSCDVHQQVVQRGIKLAQAVRTYLAHPRDEASLRRLKVAEELFTIVVNRVS